jgi:hypothetical protein
MIDFERARESMREISNLIDEGLVRVPPIEMLPLEDAARAHRMIDLNSTLKMYTRSSEATCR